MSKKTFYITTAIYYVNAAPHIGHAYEQIVADVLARWHRLLGEDVFFLTGTDDNASKNEEAAKLAGIPTREFVDKNAEQFKILCKKLNISNNDFIRTVEERHIKTAQNIFKKVYEKGDIYKGAYEGLYCKGCEAFYTEKDLIEGKCPEHKTEPQQLKEESYFFRLSKYKQQIIDLIEKKNLILPKEKSNEIISRLKSEELKDLSVSRINKSWGIKTPIDEKHTIYVWFDALINYYSATRSKGKEKYWPANIHLIGKGINFFHSVIWPGMLFSAGIKQPEHVLVHGYLTVDGQKIGKSLGNVIDPIFLIEKYGIDALRYFILREIPFGSDGDFSEKALQERLKSELANDLGNLLQRTVSMIEKYNDGVIPKPDKLTDFEEKLFKKDLFKELNKYVNESAPWKEQDKKRLNTILYNLIEGLRIISLIAWPFIPETAEKIAFQIDQKITNFKKIQYTTKTKGKIQKGEILFKLKEVVEQPLFSKLNLKVGVVQEVKDHPNAEKLYVLKVNLGSEVRQLVAGVKQFYTNQQLTGTHIIIVSNLKPANLRGVESQGMLLAAQLDNNVKVLEAPNSSAGEQVFIQGIQPSTAQITIEDFATVVLTTKDKKTVWNNNVLKTKKEEVKVDIGDGAKIR